MGIHSIKSNIHDYREGLQFNRKYNNKTGVDFLDSRPIVAPNIPFPQKLKIKKLLMDKNNDPRFFVHKTITFLSKEPKIIQFDNGFSIQQGTQLKIQHTSDTDVLGDLSVGVESDYFVLDNQNRIIGFIDKGDNKKAICHLLLPLTDSNSKMPIENILLWNLDFSLDLTSGSIDFEPIKQTPLMSDNELNATNEYMSKIVAASKSTASMQNEQAQPGT